MGGKHAGKEKSRGEVKKTTTEPDTEQTPRQKEKEQRGKNADKKKVQRVSKSTHTHADADTRMHTRMHAEWRGQTKMKRERVGLWAQERQQHKRRNTPGNKQKRSDGSSRGKTKAHACGVSRQEKRLRTTRAAAFTRRAPLRGRCSVHALPLLPRLVHTSGGESAQELDGTHQLPLSPYNLVVHLPSSPPPSLGCSQRITAQLPSPPAAARASTTSSSLSPCVLVSLRTVPRPPQLLLVPSRG